MVLGGLDGLIATFIIISAATGTTCMYYYNFKDIINRYHLDVGANLSWKITLVLGIANLLGNGLSMGISEFMSSKANREYINAEKRRAMWQYRYFKPDEIVRVCTYITRDKPSSYSYLCVYMCLFTILDDKAVREQWHVER